MSHEIIQDVVAALRGARRVLFITGAGMSADSGMATYRGVGGLYDGVDTEEGIPIEEALSGSMFRKRPELTWKYLAQIEESARGKVPNRGHEVIAEMEARFESVWTLTQNVDGFHTLAGSRQVIEIHGNMRHLECTRCSWERSVNAYDEISVPPYCPECEAICRPRVVLFGEMLLQAELQKYAVAISEPFDIVFSVGTTSVFPYIAQPVRDAARSGIPTVEINPGRTDVSGVVTYRIEAGAAETLDAIWNALGLS
jgi:NAD-dependent deacetylase